MATKVVLVDAGTGNLRSVYKALTRVGAVVALSNDPDVISSGERVILPGVGSFGDFMVGLHTNGIDQAIHEVANRGVPLLGICVGMQAFFQIGLEMGQHKGLGLISGQVVRFPDQTDLKIPHTGWNQLRFQADSILWKSLHTEDYAYFNHSYYCSVVEQPDIISTTDYILQFASAIQKENLCGVQFHPEKSQKVGLQILANFLTL
jgi:glutamine amidotransferase